MCGIAGFIRKSISILGPGGDSAIKDAIYFQRLRGVDALGMFKIDKKNVWSTLKKVGDPLVLMNNDKEVKSFIEYAGDNYVFLAHNRHATKGDKKSQPHAHPFEVKKPNGNGEIIMVHNGTIQHFQNEKKFPGLSDSHQIAKMLAAGMSVTEIENNVWGSYALVWYDTEDDTMNFVRNKERPFGFVHSPDSLWFGSETYIIGGAMDRHNIKLEEFKRLPVFEHWKYHLDDNKFEIIPVTERTLVFSKGSTLITEADLWEGDPSMTDFENLDRPDYSKSMSSGSTSVLPFRAPDYSRRHSTKTKPRWTLCEEHSGYKKDDEVIFSLADYRATTRLNQVNLEGNLITFDSQNQPRLDKRVDVYGMVGKNIADVDSSRFLWKGTISNIYRSTEGSIDRYQFFVKDIKELIDGDEDRFREIQRASTYATGNEEVQNPLKPSVILPNPPLPPDHTIATRSTEGRDSPSSASFSQCGDCQKWFSPLNLFRIKKKDEVYLGSISLCGSCARDCATNDSHLEKLFAAKKAASVGTSQTTEQRIIH